MRILVVSDNHGNKKVLEDVLKKEVFDVSIHLGDSELSEEFMKNNFMYFVQGNHDSYLPIETTAEIDGIKFAMAHGHTVGISVMNVEKPALSFAKTTGADIVLHGHTHIFGNKVVSGKTIICPGALSLSRGPEGNGYAIIETEPGKIKSVEFRSLYD